MFTLLHHFGVLANDLCELLFLITALLCFLLLLVLLNIQAWLRFHGTGRCTGGNR